MWSVSFRRQLWIIGDRRKENRRKNHDPSVSATRQTRKIDELGLSQMDRKVWYDSHDAILFLFTGVSAQALYRSFVFSIYVDFPIPSEAECCARANSVNTTPFLD